MTNTATAAPANKAVAPRQPYFFELSRLMVVAIQASNGRLSYIAQTKPNGPWQTAWTPIDTTQTYGAMAAGLTGDGRVAVIAQNQSASALYYIDEAPDSVAVERWNAPVSLGKPPGIGSFYYLTMAVDAGARIEIFGTDNNGGIWWKYQSANQIVQKRVTVTPPGTTTPITVTVDEIVPPATPWSQWVQMPGSLGQIRALRNADGRLIVFGINSHGSLYRNEQKIAQALTLGDWTGWIQMDNNFSGVFSAMASVLDAAGAVNLFAINTGPQVLHARQSPPGSQTWTGWTTPGVIRGGVQAVAAGLDGDSHLVLVATDSGKMHNVNTQHSVEEQQWSGWNAFSQTDYPVQSALDYSADGRLTFFTHWVLPPGPSGGLWCTPQVAFNSTEWDLSWTTLMSGDIKQYAVVRDLTPPA